MTIEKMPKVGGKTAPVAKAVDSVHKSKIKQSKHAVKPAKPTKATKPKKRGQKPGHNGRTGYRAPQTIERMTAKRLMIQRITQSTDGLLNAQLNKAHGETFLMCRTTTGKGREKRVSVDVVTDTETIKAFLMDDGDTLNHDGGDDDKYYYYISKKPADNNAIQSLFDRAYGKATEKVELGGKDEGDLTELGDEELDAKIDKYLDRRRRAK